MKSFTYADYINCIHKYRLHAVMNLMEESVKYEKNIIKRKEDEIYDKFILELIRNKHEIKDMIEIMNLDIGKNIKITERNLQFIGDKRIKTRFNMKKIDGLYKILGTEIYIAIEYQKEKSVHVNWRMLNYCIDIMKDWLTDEKNKEKNVYPQIIPIVLQNEDVEEQKDEKIDFKVNLINIKRFLMKKRFE